MEASSADLMTLLEGVNDEVIQEYYPLTDNILENLSPRDALSRALALMSGHQDGFKQRSFITDQEGLVTYQIMGPFPEWARGLFPLFQIFDPFYGRDNKKPISNVRKIQTGGFVFDIFEDKMAEIDAIASQIEKNGYELFKCDELPLIEPFEGENMNNSGFQRNHRGRNAFQNQHYQKDFEHFDRPKRRSWSVDQDDEFREPWGHRNDRNNSLRRNSRFNYSVKNGDFRENLGTGSMMSLVRTFGSVNRIGMTALMPKKKQLPKPVVLGMFSMASMYLFFKR